MLLAMFAVFFQFQRATMIVESIPGNETRFTRGSVQMSWIAAREACDNMSNAMVSDIQSDRALGLLRIGELAWIDGKEYSFCYSKNISETSETCKYVTVMREDIRNNHTYICNTGEEYKSSDEILSYTDAANTCRKSSASLQVVENFAVPLVVPVNRTYWIKDYNATSIINRLRMPLVRITFVNIGDSRILIACLLQNCANENVTEICIGIVKLGHDIFEFGTASCDATHTVICDASGVPTALTLTIREVMMPRLADLKASNQSQADDLIFIVLCSTVWVIPFAISIIAIVKFRKKRLIKGIANNSVYQKRRSDAKRKHDRETLPQNYSMRWANKSESKSLPCHSNKIEDQGNDLRDASDGEDYDNIDPQLDLYENPINTEKSTSRYHIQGHAILAKHAALGKNAISSESEKGLLTDRISLSTQKYMSMHVNERDRKVVNDTENETLYENFNQVDMSIGMSL